MSISPRATALCRRRSVPLRSASETRNITMSPPLSVMMFGPPTQFTLSVLVAGGRSTLSQVARRQRVEHHLGHPDRVLRAATPDDQGGERHVAAIPGEPGMRPTRELGFPGLSVHLTAAGDVLGGAVGHDQPH